MRIVSSTSPSLRRLLNFDLGPPLRRWTGRNLLVVCALTIAVWLLAAISERWPYLNGPSEWTWRYHYFYDFWPLFVRSLWKLAPAGLVLGAGAWLTRRRLRGRIRNALLMTLLMLWGVAFHYVQFGAAGPFGFTHMGRTILDPMTTSYYTVGMWMAEGRWGTPAATLARYHELNQTEPGLPLHASTHPPGAPLVCWLVREFFTTNPVAVSKATAVYQKLGMQPPQMRMYIVGTNPPVEPLDQVAAMTIGILVALIGLSTAIPLYLIVKRTWPARHTARSVAWCAALLWVHYPALVIFEPSFDQVLPLIVLLQFVALERALAEHPIGWGMLIGWLFMLGVLFSFSLLLMAPLLALLAALHALQCARSFRPAAIASRMRWGDALGRRIWLAAGAAALTATGADLLLRLAGIRLYAIFRSALDFQYNVMVDILDRSYRVWVFFSVWDFLLLAGPALATLALVFCVAAARIAWRRPIRVVPAWAIYPLAVLLINVSGLLIAETGRVWMFMAPGMAWAGAAALAHRTRGPLAFNLILILLMQAATIYLYRARMTFMTM